MKKFLTALMLLAAVSCSPAADDQSARQGWEDMFKPVETPTEESSDPGESYDPESGERWFKMIGIICCWTDVAIRSKLDYIDIAKRTGINTFSIYNCDKNSSVWKSYTAECARNGIDIEFEEHMVGWLLPRDLFNQGFDSDGTNFNDYYRMNDRGIRVNDVNGCPSCPATLDTVRARAMIIGERYRSTNNKYYCWLDDGGDICHCPKCKDLNPADQALLFENATLEGLRAVNPEATLAHLAYYNTVEAPKKIKPSEGIFLEFAPIDRDHSRPMSEANASGKDARTHGQYLKALSDNLKVFPVETAQVLDYWLDCSLFSGWDETNLKQVPWNQALFEDDVKTYASYGIRNITTYTSYISANYVKKFGYPDCIDKYATYLRDFVKK